MHGAKPNSIKSKMDQMDQVPEGFRYNHTATWEKLEKNLQKEKPVDRRLWLFAAAVILLGVGFLLLKTNMVSPTKEYNENKVVITEGEQEVPAKSFVLNELDKPAGHPKVMSNAQIKKTSKRSNQEEQLSASSDSVVVLDKSPSIIADIVFKLPDTVNNQVLTSSKPKFKIAHINEINRPAETLDKTPASVVYKKPLLSSINEQPLNKEDKIIATKKIRSIFSPVSSSQ